MKNYNFNELKKIAKDQNYKTASLENSQGDRVFGFNQLKTDINKQLTAIEKRLSAEILPNGNYFVCMAHNIPRQKNPDKYPILKGNEAEIIKQPEIRFLSQPTPEVLSWGEALKLHSELAQLREENKTLKAENLELKEELLCTDIESTNLKEETPPMINSLGTFLKEQSPIITGVLDEYFKTKNRQLDIEERKLNKSNPEQKTQQPGLRRKVIMTPGSKEHLTLIEHWYNQNNEIKLNEQLDILENANPELYNEILVKLNLNAE